MAPLDDDKRLKEDRLIMVGLAIVAATLLVGVYFLGRDYREKSADKRSVESAARAAGPGSTGVRGLPRARS
jgi:hypothetical protein